MKIIFEIVLCLGLSVNSIKSQSRQITVVNSCSQSIWVNPMTNGNGPSLPDGIVQLSSGNTHGFNIPDSGWGGRFWPKMGCDGNGQNCQVGQSVPPCGPTGCQPPADTKVEFHFPAAGASDAVWYDVSLVDGYSLAAQIDPSTQDSQCVSTSCAVSLNDCPTNEQSVGDLRVVQNGQTVQCLAPCKKWNYPSPYGMGQNEQQEPGLHFCCPTPPIYPEECRVGPVVSTQYVNLIHRKCPSAYSYAYDDEAGLHTCPSSTSFTVTFSCP